MDTEERIYRVVRIDGDYAVAAPGERHRDGGFSGCARTAAGPRSTRV